MGMTKEMFGDMQEACPLTEAEEMDLMHQQLNAQRESYQVYLNGQWIADCNDYCEAETIANANAMNGSVDIERSNF